MFQRESRMDSLKNSSKLMTIAVIILLCQLVRIGAGGDEEYLRLTYDEKATLDKFRNEVQANLTTANMKEDIYLIRWLRVRNFDIQQAKEMLLENIRWRMANRMDSVLKEDWSDMKEEYPYYRESHDKAGRPIVVLNLGMWNFRRAAITGRMPRLKRYQAMILEESTNAVIEDQYRGKNVARLKVLMNLDGINIFEHTCPLCLQAYTSFMTTYQNHYTGYTEAFILINTPPTFKIVLDVISPLFTPQTKKILKKFGKNKKEWMPYLDKEISKEERRPEFGGTKSDR